MPPPVRVLTPHPSPPCSCAPPQGLPTVQAPGEGEATCAALSALGLVDGCVTSDSDALLFGAEMVYRDLALQVGARTRTALPSHLWLCRVLPCRPITVFD